MRRLLGAAAATAPHPKIEEAPLLEGAQQLRPSFIAEPAATPEVRGLSVVAAQNPSKANVQDGRRMLQVTAWLKVSIAGMTGSLDLFCSAGGS